MTDETWMENNPPPGRPRINAARWALLLFSLLLTIGVYARSFQTEFILDDEVDIQSNPFLRMETLSLSELKKAAFNERCPNRPLANLTFALNLFIHGERAWGFHLVNLAIHLVTGLLLFLLVRQTLELSRVRDADDDKPPDFAFAAAVMTMLIWLIHPVHTQSVTYIVQRMNGLSAMFYLLCLLLYLNGRLHAKKVRKTAFFLAAGLSGAMALGSKENAAMLPFSILLYEWLFLTDAPGRFFRRAIPLAVGAGVLLAIVSYAWWSSHPLTANGLMHGYAMRDFSMGQRLLTEMRVLVFYIGLLIFPHPGRLNLDLDYPLSSGLFFPVTTCIALATIIALICLGFYTARKNRLLTLAILWYLGNLVIESTFIPLEIIFEHRLYLPSMMPIALFVVWAMGRLPSIRLAVVFFALIAVLLAGWTHVRNGVWQDEIRLWEDAAKKSPRKPRPYINLAKTMLERNRPEDAAAFARRALEIDPASKEAHINLGIAELDQDNLPEAIRHLQESVRLDPDYAPAHLHLGDALALQGELDAAVGHYRMALRLTPLDAGIHNNLGRALARQGLHEEAIRHFRQAEKLRPDYPEVQFNLGIAAWEEGRIDDAIAFFEKTEEIGTSNPDIHFQMGNVYFQTNRFIEAESAYRKTLDLNPEHVRAREYLAYVLIQLDKVEAAIPLLREVLKTNSANADAHHNLGAALARNNQLGEAISHFTAALKLDPSISQARGNLERALVEYKNGFGQSTSAEDLVNYFSGLLALHPEDMETRSALAGALAGMGRQTEALDQCRKGIEISPDSPEVHFRMANLLASTGKFDEAIVHYQEVLRKNPSHMEARQNLGVAYTRMNQFDKAAEAFSHILAKDPKKQDVMFNLGVVEQGRGRLDEAIRVFRNLLQVNPDYTDARLELANTLAVQGKNSDAEAEYLSLLSIQPDLAMGHYYLGNLMAQQQRFQEAETAFAEALRLKPDFSEARRNLNQISRILGAATDRKHPKEPDVTSVDGR